MSNDPLLKASWSEYKDISMFLLHIAVASPPKVYGLVKFEMVLKKRTRRLRLPTAGIGRDSHTRNSATILPTCVAKGGSGA